MGIGSAKEVFLWDAIYARYLRSRTNAVFTYWCVLQNNHTLYRSFGVAQNTILVALLKNLQARSRTSILAEAYQ